MLIPLRTDAPLYHRPWATVGIIAANIAVHIWSLGAEPEAVVRLVLRYGEWVPWQWLTSVFAHDGWFHLFGNMLFLWVFGLIVEGKIGWWRFLVLYGGIAVAANMFGQTIMLGGDGGAIGASGVIYGLIAISMVWAPENEVECLFGVGLWVRRVELQVKTLAGIYLTCEVVFALITGFNLSSAVLHLIGAAAGLPIGIVMLKRGWVDCEGWDWFSRRDYRAAPIRSSLRAPAAVVAGTPSCAPRVAPARPLAARFAAQVKSGDVEGARRLHAACSAAERAILPLPERVRLIHALVECGRGPEARLLIAEVLRADPRNPGLGLLEAELLLRERSLSKADRVLVAIEGRLESDQQRQRYAILAAQAEALRAAGVLEFDD